MTLAPWVGKENMQGKNPLPVGSTNSAVCAPLLIRPEILKHLASDLRRTTPAVFATSEHLSDIIGGRRHNSTAAASSFCLGMFAAANRDRRRKACTLLHRQLYVCGCESGSFAWKRRN